MIPRDDYYSEASQPSPIRFVNYNPKTKKFESHWWKCKDFMNDVVIHYRLGKAFSMYGFENEHVNIDADGGYLKYKNAPDHFADTVNNLIAPFLKKLGLPVVTVTDDTVHIPEAFWRNTYLISMVTSLIRTGAYPTKPANLAAAFALESTLYDLSPLRVQNFWKKHKDTLEKEVFVNYSYRASSLPSNTNIYHNAGHKTISDSLN